MGTSEVPKIFRVRFSLFKNIVIVYNNKINMIFRKIIDQLNIGKQCRKHGLSLWQCPQFLFLILGLVIIFSILSIYFVGIRYIEEPLLVVLLVLFISIILFVISLIIVRSFEKMAEANRLKSEFISIVSHQLRSPLSNLKWVTELLTSGRIPASQKQTEYFDILRENSDRMRDLILDLLIVSKLDRGKFSLKMEKVFLADLIEKAIKEAESFAKASNVKMTFEYEKTLPQTLTDSFHIKLAFKNLLDNAIRYIESGGKVEVFLKKKEHKLYAEIKDNGVGIPKEDQKYIFQKFFRSENIKKRQTEGSGLDLYVAKSIIEKLGGKIGFKSQEGVGSTFWLMLPIK